jgi:hypothetical protein
MTHNEHHDLVTIATGDPWVVRPKLMEFLKTVRIEEYTSNDPIIEEVVQKVSTGLVAPQEAIVALNLDGTEKVPYPIYPGPPTV